MLGCWSRLLIDRVNYVVHELGHYGDVGWAFCPRKRLRRQPPCDEYHALTLRVVAAYQKPTVGLIVCYGGCEDSRLEIP